MGALHWAETLKLSSGLRFPNLAAARRPAAEGAGQTSAHGVEARGEERSARAADLRGSRREALGVRESEKPRSREGGKAVAEKPREA